MNDQFTVHNFKKLNSASLDIRNYSELKFGSDRVARLFGTEMADKFYEEYYDLLIHNKCIIIPSVYNIVELASTILAQHFMNRLNYLLVQNGHDTIQWTTMSRDMSYFSDYCTKSADVRDKMLKGDTFYINKDYIKDKVLIFVDDSTISGAHQRKMEDFLRESGITNHRIFCYYVRYTGEDASIESRLNKSGIRTVDQYIRLTKEYGHHIVVRGIRFLIELPSEELKLALQKFDDEFIIKMYPACISKEYYKTKDYHYNLELVKMRYDEITHVN
jgi:hypothetical protein